MRTPAFVVRRIGFYVLICAITLFFAVPMLWLASALFDATPSRSAWPDWTLDNVRKTLEHPHALHSMVNSLVICVTTAVAVTAFAALASYALSRVRLGGTCCCTDCCCRHRSSPGPRRWCRSS